ncbi:MAG: CAP domain-containing protein [Dietzia sp.]
MRRHLRPAIAAGAATLLLVSGAGSASAQGSLEFTLPFGLVIPGLSSLAPAAAPEPAAAVAGDPSGDLLPEEVRLMAFEGSVVAAVNEARLVVGADRLVTDPALEASARERAAELAAGGPEADETPAPAGEATGDADAEADPDADADADRTVVTLPAGGTPQKTLSAMLTDTEMRERMLDGGFTRVGVGVATAGDGTVLVVQDYARG